MEPKDYGNLGYFVLMMVEEAKMASPSAQAYIKHLTQVVSTGIPLAKASQEAKPKVSNPKVYSAYHEAVTQV